jgi:hypothetical protein
MKGITARYVIFSLFARFFIINNANIVMIFVCFTFVKYVKKYKKRTLCNVQSKKVINIRGTVLNWVDYKS